MNKLKVGQKLFRKENGEFIEKEISYVGRVYFRFKGDPEWKRFWIENLVEDATYGSGERWHLKQAILDDEEFNDLASDLTLLHYYRLSLGQLRRIMAIAQEVKP